MLSSTIARTGAGTSLFHDHRQSLISIGMSRRWALHVILTKESCKPCFCVLLVGDEGIRLESRRDEGELINHIRAAAEMTYAQIILLYAYDGRLDRRVEKHR